MELIDIVRKLVGPTYPIGETHADEDRFKNVKQMGELTIALVQELSLIATERKDHQHSVQKIGMEAQRILDQIADIAVWDQPVA